MLVEKGGPLVVKINTFVRKSNASTRKYTER